MRRGGGRRDAGRNGYVWTCSTPEQRLFQYGSRAKAMLATILGEAFAGVLVSDFYGAYTSHEGLHQYCWAHLVRDIHDLTTQHPDDPAVQGWAVTMEALFARARAGATGSREARWAVRTEVQTAAKLVRPPGSAHDVPHRKLRAHPEAPGIPLRLRDRSGGAADQQRGGAQSASAGGGAQDQRRDPLRRRDHDEADARLALRDVAGARHQPVPRLPGSPFPRNSEQLHQDVTV